MRRFDDTFDRAGALPLIAMRDAGLPGHKLGYTAARWRQRLDGPSDGDFSRRQPYGWPWDCRPALFSSLKSPCRCRSRSHRRHLPSPWSSQRSRRDRFASQIRRQPSRRWRSANRSIRSVSSGWMSAMRKIGWARRANVPMPLREQSGTISARIAGWTSISISTCRRG